MIFSMLLCMILLFKLWNVSVIMISRMCEHTQCGKVLQSIKLIRRVILL
jgi:hypothetical protein